MVPNPTSKVAFVTGVNGISGYAIVEELVRKPKSEWEHIIITSRSPLPNFWSDPRVTFVALDFLKPVEETIARMRGLCENVTHAFFASYVHSDDFKVLKEYNEPLFRNFLVALESVATTTLQNVCLQTGGKNYGVHLGPVPVPLEESTGRYEDHGENFYYPQEDFMFERQKGKSWSHTIIRPNAIVGFTPGNTGMSQVLTAAIYFLICRELGESGVFPGNKILYNTVDDSSYSPSIADLSIYASTHDNCKNEAFNHTNGDVIVWKYFWPKIGKRFGLEIPEPTFEKAMGATGGLEMEFSMIEWVKDKKPVWDKICEKHGGNKEAFNWATWGFFDWAMGKAWLSISSISKARKFGWTRFDDTTDAWLETFKSFENSGILPRV